ncbi:MAG: alginate export family protein [bacterium]|nr:alginate export family protein [bacterium]
MKYLKSSVCVFCAGLLLLSATARAEDEPTGFAESLKNGTAAISLRYRFENVSDDAVVRDAEASTLRTTLSYRTQKYKKVSLFAEAENVTAVGDDNYRNLGAGSLSNGVTDRAVVADPALTELNQAYLRWDNGKTKWTIGRQEILYGDQRYVGAVGWRQNHQSFDGLNLVSQAVEKWTFSYSFLTAVNRIFGDSQDLAAHLANAKFDWDGVGALTLYGFLLDYDDVAALSSSTFGAELSGKKELEGDWALLYEIELAQQSDAGDNPADLDVGYRHLALGGSRGKLTVRVGLEVLEGSAGGAFRTPLATLHKFNGWADKFLATPRDGLEDLYLEVRGKCAKGVGWAAIYHDFGATEGGASYGEELDLLATYKTSWNQTIGLKGALYDAESHAADTDKWMLWTAYSF